MSTSIAFDLIAKDRASQTFDKVGKSADSAGDKLGKAGGQAEVSGGKFEKMGKLAKAGGAAVAAAAIVVGKGLLTAMDNEKFNDRLAASLGATPKLAEKYGKAASNLYQGAWGESMADVDDAIEAVASSFKGLGAGKDLERVTAQAMDFATIFRVDIPRATSVASTMIRAGLAKDATQALDLLTVSAQKVPAALRENILDAVDEYGQFFHTIGMDGPQALATLVAASKKGEFGIDKMGDAVKEFTIRATDMSASTKGAYKAIGVDAGRMANLILAGGDAAATGTSVVVKGLLGIKDPAKQAQAAIALFGTPLEDLNVKDIPDFLRSLQAGEKGLGKFDGAIDKAGETLNDNASTKIEAYKRQITQTFVDTLGNKVIPKLEEFGPTAAKIGDFLEDDVLPPLKKLGEDYLVGVKDGFSELGDQLDDNEGFLRMLGGVITKDVIPAMGWLIRNGFPLMATAIGTGITFVRKYTSALLTMGIFGVKSFRVLLGAAFASFGGILAAADKGLTWIPGLGDRIHVARVAFDKFKDRGVRDLKQVEVGLHATRDAINGIKPKNVKVNVDTGDAVVRLDIVKHKIDGLHGKTINIYAKILTSRLPTGKTPTNSDLGIPNDFGSNIGQSGHARGGYTLGRATPLHEQGPEIVDLPRGSRVYPAGRSAQMIRDAAASGLSKADLEEAFYRALCRMPVFRLPDAGRGAYLSGAGI